LALITFVLLLYHLNMVVIGFIFIWIKFSCNIHWFVSGGPFVFFQVFIENFLVTATLNILWMFHRCAWFKMRISNWRRLRYSFIWFFIFIQQILLVFLKLLTFFLIFRYKICWKKRFCFFFCFYALLFFQLICFILIIRLHQSFLEIGIIRR